MANYNHRSMANLGQCHPKLVKIAYRVIERYDHSIITGYRGEAEQNQKFADLVSMVMWPLSRHNKRPSVALDAIPYPKGYEASDREFVEMAAHYMKAAKEEGVELVWGGFFLKKDGTLFFDAGHFHLADHEYEEEV